MWLSGIARNSVALHFRKQRRWEEKQAAASVPSQQPADRGGETEPPGVSRFGRSATRLLAWLENRRADPGAALEAAETADRVQATLAALPRDYETLLVAKYIDEASLAQLAAAERSTSGAICSKLARARQAFREAFARTSQRKRGTGPVAEATVGDDPGGAPPGGCPPRNDCDKPDRSPFSPERLGMLL